MHNTDNNSLLLFILSPLLCAKLISIHMFKRRILTLLKDPHIWIPWKNKYPWKNPSNDWWWNKDNWINTKPWKNTNPWFPKNK